jgi:hypothetical protein
MRGAAQTSDPVVVYLYQLLDAIGAGRLLIPKFQRDLIWKWDRKSELLRSVQKGIPIGAVMLWRTTTERVGWRTELAGQELPPPPPGSPRDYLLDGYQRLGTLFAALRESENFDAPTSSGVGYDLDEEEFVEVFDPVADPQVVPLCTLGDTSALLRFQRALTGERADLWLKRADELARAFRECKIPAISIASDDFEVAVRTFNLLNSQGMRMGEADMIHALTWSPTFELRDQLEAQRSELLQPLGWGAIDFETVLKVVKAEADLGLYEEAVEQLSERLKTDHEALLRAFGDLALTAEMLRDHCGIHNWELVPYELQAVLLADAFRVAGFRDVRALLADWFWLTTYGEMFAGLSGHRIALAIRDLRAAVEHGRLQWSGPSPFRVRPIPRSADFRGARVKAVALMLARHIREVERSNFGSDLDLEPFAMLSEHGRSAMFQLIPRRHLTRDSFSSVGNRFLCRPPHAVALRTRLLGGQLSPEERDAHVVTREAQEAGVAGQWDLFVSIRLREIATLEEAFVRDLLTRHPGIQPINAA